MHLRIPLLALLLLSSANVLANGGQTTVPTDLPTAVDPAHSVRSNPGALGRWKEKTISFDYSSAPMNDGLNPIAMGVQITTPLFGNVGFGADFYQYFEGARDAAIGFGFVGRNTEFGIGWRFGIAPLQKIDNGEEEEGSPESNFAFPDIPDGTRLDLSFLQNIGSWLRLFAAVRNVREAGTEPRSIEAGVGLRPFGDSFEIHANGRVETNGNWISTELLFRKERFQGVTIDLGLSMGDTNYISDNPVISSFVRIGFGFGGGGLYEPFGTSMGDLGGENIISGLRVTYGQMNRSSILGGAKKGLLFNLSDFTSEAPPKAIFGAKKASFAEAVATLLKYAERPDISTLILRIDGASLGWGQADDLRAVVDHYQSKNKKVVALIRTAGPTGIYIASAADTVVMDPAGAIMLQGLYRSIRFLAPGLSRLGVTFQTVRHAEYKSFPEIFTRGEPTPEFLEASNRNLDVVSGQLRSALSEREKISAEGAQAILDGGPFNAQTALKHGLVDQLLPLDDLYKAKASPLNFLKTEEFSLPNARTPQRWNSREKIALIVVDGNIVRGTSSKNILTSQRNSGDHSIIKALKKAANGNYSAVIVRIDSPGGDAIASESMGRALKKLNKKKPVIVSFGNTAASGGYMFATGDKVPIIAAPLSVTGSIGVFALKIIYRELTDDMGLPVTALGRGKRAGIFSADRPWNEEEERALQVLLRDVYKRFVLSVAQARGHKYESLEKNCRGRVWMGKDALDKDLVDSTGGLPEALEQARIKGGFESHSDYELEYIPTRGDFLQNILGGGVENQSQSNAVFKLAQTLGIDTLSWALLAPPGAALARMPNFNNQDLP
jgi:protease-4